MGIDIICPFCHEKDFDLIGLKYHFEMGYCKEYNDTSTVEEERNLRSIKDKIEDGK
jgi:hypothetical protein